MSTTHPVMGTTMDYSRYIKALLAPCERATTVGGIDLMSAHQSGLGFESSVSFWFKKHALPSKCASHSGAAMGFSST